MTLRSTRGALVGLGVVALTSLAGCGLARPDAGAARATADELYRAVAAGDGAAACALVAPSTVETLEEDTGAACDEAILAGEVGDTLTTRAEGAGDPTARVAGRQAQVALTTDVLFLTLSGDHFSLRERGSPESKPVGSPHDSTGVEG